MTALPILTEFQVRFARRGDRKTLYNTHTQCPKLYLFLLIFLRLCPVWFTVALVPEFEEHPGGGIFSCALRTVYGRSNYQVNFCFLVVIYIKESKKNSKIALLFFISILPPPLVGTLNNIYLLCDHIIYDQNYHLSKLLP